MIIVALSIDFFVTFVTIFVRRPSLCKEHKDLCARRRPESAKIVRGARKLG